MASSWILLVSFTAVTFCSAISPGRIWNGESTSIQQYQSIVQVESTSAGLSWSQSCAGSILNNRFIVSAAQCFSGSLYSNSRRRIRGGSASRGSGGVVVAVRRVFNHPNYRASTNEADITIVEQAAAWLWSTTIQPVAIIAQDFELPDGLPVTVAGWGRTRGGLFGGSASTLQEATMYTVSREVCAGRYASLLSPRLVDDSMLCAGAPGGHYDTCEGDEGGPVLLDDANGQRALVGVISWRHACGNATMPSVNTRLAAYTNWIIINAV